MLAGILLTRRKKCGLSQRALAARAGLTHGYIAQLEQAEAMPTLETLMRLSDALGIRLTTLTGQIENACVDTGVSFKD